ncbi:MAG: FAD-dependent oxidoreductase [Pseudonocardiaceae bacterium]
MVTLPPVLVIGAGVIGLSTAVTLAEAGYPVVVRTAEPSEATTSAVAGALWGPWLVKPRHRVLRWAEHTLTTLCNLAAHRDTGVRLAAGIDASDVPHDPPDWAHLLPDRRPCTREEIPAGYGYGTRCTVPLVDMPTYLTERLTVAGGAIQIKSIESLDDVAHSWPLIVNCTGLGAHALVPDHQVHPVRGHHVIVSNPGLTDFIETDTGDSPDLIAIYPHPGHVVLGGTAEVGKWDRTPNPAIGQAILERCTRLESRLADAQVIDHLVGLRHPPPRPGRSPTAPQWSNHRPQLRPRRSRRQPLLGLRHRDHQFNQHHNIPTPMTSSRRQPRRGGTRDGRRGPAVRDGHHRHQSVCVPRHLG